MATWVQRFMVSSMELCLASACAILGCTPLMARFVMKVWRSGWKSATFDVSGTCQGQTWQIDMTSFVLRNLVTLYLVLVIDVFDRKIAGWKLSRRCRADEWLAALDAAVIAEFQEGVRGKGLTLRADNGSQPTSRKFAEHLDVLGITGEWTGYNTPESNACVERVIRTVKEDGIWPNEFEDEAEA